MAHKDFDPAKIPQYRRTLYVFVALVVGVVFIIITAILDPPSPETPAQAEARQKELQRLMAQQAEQAAQDQKASRYKDELCHTKLVCRRYHSARQDCAVAGNFDNCMHIKISDKDWTYMSLCTNDGDVDVPQYVSDMPSEVECAARNAVQWLK
jgi:hypothetical protein